MNSYIVFLFSFILNSRKHYFCKIIQMHMKIIQVTIFLLKSFSNIQHPFIIMRFDAAMRKIRKEYQ